MKRPCKVAITCEGIGPQPEPDWPVTNYSAEAPDPLVFADIVYPGIGIDPQGCFYTRDCPSFTSNGCYGVVYSAESQEMANTLAAASMLNCPPAFPPGTGRVYANDERTATVYCPDGTAFTYTVAAGTLVSPLLDDVFGPSWQAMANEWAQAYALERASELMQCIVVQPPTRRTGGGPLLTDNPGWACLDEMLDPALNIYSITNTGGASYTFEISGGSLPSGVFLTQTGPSTAVLEGMPAVPGVYNYQIRATSVSQPSLVLTVNDSLQVFGIANTVLPDASDGSAYSEQLTVQGGNVPITFVLADGSSMPTGLTMTDAGLISGTPSIIGSYSFGVVITDATGKECTQSISLSVVASCVPDTGPTTPFVQPSLFANPDLYLPNWNTEKLGLVVAGADPPGVQPEWDGTLPILDYATIPGSAYYLPVGGFLNDVALNGMLGAVGAQTLSQGGALSDWVLDLWVMVGGVPTRAWIGQKAVGTCAAGTYLRTGGASAGPGCFHVSSTQPCTTELAWWTMDVAAAAEPDSINGLILSNGDPLSVSHVAGHVSAFALRIHCVGNFSKFSFCQSATLSFLSTGITIACWVRLTYNVANPGNNEGEIRYDFYVAGIFHTFRILHVEGAVNWIVSLDGVPTGSVKAFAAGWHFLAFTFDAATGVVGFDIDQSGVSAGATAAMNADASPLTTIYARDHTLGLGDMDADFEELAVFRAVLTQPELDWIYNAGVGKTWPI